MKRPATGRGDCPPPLLQRANVAVTRKLLEFKKEQAGNQETGSEHVETENGDSERRVHRADNHAK